MLFCVYKQEEFPVDRDFVMKERYDKGTTIFGKAVDKKGQDVYIQNSLINNVGRNKI